MRLPGLHKHGPGEVRMRSEHAEGLNTIEYPECVTYYYSAIMWHELLLISRTITPCSCINSMIRIDALCSHLHNPREYPDTS